MPTWPGIMSIPQKHLHREARHLKHINYLRKTLANRPNSAILHTDMADVAIFVKMYMCTCMLQLLELRVVTCLYSHV